jgi:hypothetical protein
MSKPASVVIIGRSLAAEASGGTEALSGCSGDDVPPQEIERNRIGISDHLRMMWPYSIVRPACGSIGVVGV